MNVFSVLSQVIYLETARPVYILAVFSVSSVSSENRVSKKNIDKRTLAFSIREFFILADLSKNTQGTRDTGYTFDSKGVFLCTFEDTLEALKTIGQLKIYITAMTYA